MKEKILMSGILGILGIISLYLLINHFLFSVIIVLLIFVSFYAVSLNNRQRKENLNIIKDEDKLYFYLSDDLLCQVNIAENKNFSETLSYSINNEMHSLKNLIKKINFINFKNDSLLSEVNAKL